MYRILQFLKDNLQILTKLLEKTKLSGLFNSQEWKIQKITRKWKWIFSIANWIIQNF